MREIKFRGLTKDGKWVYGWYQQTHGYKEDEKHYIIDCCGVTSTALVLAHTLSDLPGYHEVIPETVGQSTGLKDKNGKEIYQHDKITVSTDGLAPLVMVVIWYHDGWRPTVWPCECCGKFTCDKKRRAPYILNKKDWLRCEIIGNVQQNPELLNKEKE